MVSVTGRTGRGGYIEPDLLKDTGCFQMTKGDAASVGQSKLAVAVKTDVGECCRQSQLQPITHLLHVPSLLPQFSCDELTRMAQANNPKNILRPRPATALLACAVTEICGFNPPSDVEPPYPLGSINLMSGNREKIYPQLIHPRGDFAQ